MPIYLAILIGVSQLSGKPIKNLTLGIPDVVDSVARLGEISPIG
jgi:hypothetical protein